MKPLLALLATASIGAAQTTAPAEKAEPAAPTPTPAPAPVAKLGVGSIVTLDALAAAEWIQGEAPKAWEPGKVYILECWATWCGPCIAAIPHVNELHKKYSEKGLRVIGMNVWERTGKDPVVKFVSGKGEGMSYPVSYTPAGGAFQTQWLVPAGVRGIPHAFVVKDGKILMMTHPAGLDDTLIEALLAGGDKLDKMLTERREEEEKSERTSGLVREFQMAVAKKDAETMKTKLAELKAADPTNRMLSAMNLTFLVQTGDWDGASAAVAKLPEGPMRLSALYSSARTATAGEGAPVSFLKTLDEQLSPALESRGGLMEYQVLARVRWRAGNKEGAIAAAKKSVEAASKPPMQGKVDPASVQKFVDALEKGTLPTEQESMGWLREGMSSKGAPAAPVKPAPAPAADSAAPKSE